MSAIAITRIAVRSPLGESLEATVLALREGGVGIRTPLDLEQQPRIDAGAGEVPLAVDERGAFRAEIILAKTIDDLLNAEDRASIQSAPQRWGMVIGTTLAGMRHRAVGVRAENAGREIEADIAYARSCASAVLSHAMRDCGITGPTITVSCACASALSAVSHACTLLHAGEADAVIAGGYDPLSEFVYGGFSALQLVATGPLSPFATDREGMKLGEGAALFVLRRVEDLTAQELHSVRGVIEATAETSDAHHLTQPHPQGLGAFRALSTVVHNHDAQEPHKPDLIVAHATGTPGNDSAEYEAYRAAFGVSLASIPVVALKSRFGHPLGAAGVLELACAIGCADQGFMPTTAGRGRDRVAFPDLDLLEGETRIGAPRTIVALSAGFGGANAALRVSRGEGIVREVTACVTPRASIARTMFVTAVGAVSPAGRGVAALRARAHEGGVWPAFSEEILTPLLDQAKSRRLALLPRLMIAAVRDLLESSTLTTAELRSTPLIAANWCGTADYTERYYRDLVRAGIDLANPMLFAESVPNIGSAHCSLAFGIEAATLSVIGRRTSAVEAIMLASARIATGAWQRAIIVAGEETHPIVERVLRRGISADVPVRSSAVAILLESPIAAMEARRNSIVEIDHVLGATRPLAPTHAAQDLRRSMELVQPSSTCMRTTTSPFDAPFTQLFDNCEDAGFSRECKLLPPLSLTELGATTPLAALVASDLAQHGSQAPPTPQWLCSSDPHGASWAILARRGGRHSAR